LTNMAMADQQLSWLVRRGDWVLPDSTSDIDSPFQEHIDKNFVWYHSGGDERKLSIPVYQYEHPDDIVPTRYGSGRHGVYRPSCRLRNLAKSYNYRASQGHLTSVWPESCSNRRVRQMWKCQDASTVLCCKYDMQVHSFELVISCRSLL
jgi:hypothetical protein